MKKQVITRQELEDLADALSRDVPPRKLRSLDVRPEAATAYLAAPGRPPARRARNAVSR